MRKLVLILIAFIAAVTFIRAYDNSSNSGADLAETVISVESLD